MATNAFANVRGKAFRAEHKQGIGKESNQPFSMDIVTVLVPGGGLTEVVLPEVLPADALQAIVGEEVDFLIEIFRNAKGFGTKVIENDPTVAAYAASSLARAS